MIYVKSMLAGFLSLISAAMISFVILVVKYQPIPEGAPEQLHGRDFTSFMNSHMAWILALLIFGIGFYWELGMAAR